MALLRRLTVSEQTAAHLRTELELGLRSEAMPGVKQLAKEVGVDPKTIDAALRQLQHEGLLEGQGQGRRWRIVPPNGQAARSMRIAILDLEPIGVTEGWMVELQHVLRAAGHFNFYTEKSMMELGMDLARIKRLVNRTEADAWVIGAAPREVLEWFASQPVPAFAIFGRREGLPIAGIGVDKRPTIAAATRHLIGLGHRRIVLVTRGLRRLPAPGAGERVYLDELKAHGVSTSEYNLPDWEETKEGLQRLLKSLFQVTPPTALILDEAPFFMAAQRFLSEQGLCVPQQVSLICLDGDPIFHWCSPDISHIHWDPAPMVRRIVQWAAKVSTGQRDIKQTLTPSEFVVGGTTGPVPPLNARNE